MTDPTSKPSIPNAAQRTGSALMHLLLVCGVPGAGKTTLCRRLDEEHNFIHFDLEHPNEWPTRWGKTGFHEALYATWNSSRADFVRTLHLQYGRLFDGVVLDWGFPPAFLHWVSELQDAGVRVVWMDADATVARARFATLGRDLESFDQQMTRILEAGLPAAIPDVSVIQAYDQNGRHRSMAELVRELGIGSSG